MDGILSALTGALPQLGLGGLLTFIIGVLLKMLVDERSRHAAELDAQSRRHAEELKAKGERLAAENQRERDEHIADMAAVKEELREARKRIDELELMVDLEREARRRAEDEAARVRRQLWGRDAS